MKQYEVELVCGCCSDILHFKSEENIQKAFEKAGLGSSVTITDDVGNVVEGIDTFYGYREVKEDGSVPKEGKLERLMNNIPKE